MYVYEMPHYACKTNKQFGRVNHFSVAGNERKVLADLKFSNIDPNIPRHNLPIAERQLHHEVHHSFLVRPAGRGGRLCFN